MFEMDLDVKHRLLEACENGLEAEVAEILDSENIHLADFEGEVSRVLCWMPSACVVRTHSHHWFCRMAIRS